MYLARRVNGANPSVWPIDRMFGDARAWRWRATSAAAPGVEGISAIGHTPAQALTLLDGGAPPRLYQVNKEDIES